MSITRRNALQWLAAGSAATVISPSLAARLSPLSGQEPYQPRWDSLQQHLCPDWYRDAKFGIYFHWGLYSVPAFAMSGTPTGCTCQAGRSTSITLPPTAL